MQGPYNIIHNLHITDTRGELNISIETEWCIYTSVNYAIIGADNGLSPVWCQAIIWINAGLLLIRHSGVNFSEIWIKIQ